MNNGVWARISDAITLGALEVVERFEDLPRAVRGILFLALLVGLFALMRGLGVTGSRRVPMGRVRSF